jgi:hypothetical protein
MPDLISTDHPFTETERQTLTTLLDTLLPRSDELEMPSAAEVDFDLYLQQQAADLIPALQQTLGYFDAEFSELALQKRVELVTSFSTDHPELFMAVLPRIYDCYYQDDRVRGEIGVITGAPFPRGNEVMPGDLSLLDPVIEAGDSHRYRTI